MSSRDGMSVQHVRRGIETEMAPGRLAAMVAAVLRLGQEHGALGEPGAGRRGAAARPLSGPNRALGGRADLSLAGPLDRLRSVTCQTPARGMSVEPGDTYGAGRFAERRPG